jgi:GST-like protein
MITLYAWSTPNGRKPLILLEELGAPYTLRPVPLDGPQKAPEFLKLNPNGKIPALLDSDGGEPIIVFESGAILQHLAERFGAFLPTTGQARASALAWLHFQMSAVGPMAGQLGQFLRRHPDDAVGIAHFREEVDRVYGVLNTRLGEAPYLAGDEVSIADFATWPWVDGRRFIQLELERFPNVHAWFNRLGERPALRRAMEIKFTGA